MAFESLVVFYADKWEPFTGFFIRLRFQTPTNLIGRYLGLSTDENTTVVSGLSLGHATGNGVCQLKVFGRRRQPRSNEDFQSSLNVFVGI